MGLATSLTRDYVRHQHKWSPPPPLSDCSEHMDYHPFHSGERSEAKTHGWPCLSPPRHPVLRVHFSRADVKEISFFFLFCFYGFFSGCCTAAASLRTTTRPLSCIFSWASHFICWIRQTVVYRMISLNRFNKWHQIVYCGFAVGLRPAVPWRPRTGGGGGGTFVPPLSDSETRSQSACGCLMSIMKRSAALAAQYEAQFLWDQMNYGKSV